MSDKSSKPIDLFTYNELADRVSELENRPTFGRDFRIGMFLLCLAFVAVAGHPIVAVLGYFAMKDVIFRRES
jgi:hypothetical protein